MQTTMIAQIGLLAGSIAISSSESFSKYGNELAVLGGAAVQFGVILPFSRRHELEADRLGVDYMHRSGFDVRQAPRFWELMAAQGGGQKPPEFMSTHPDPSRRGRELRDYINQKGYAKI